MSSKLKADAIRSMGDEQRKAVLVEQARLLMDLKVQRATDRLEAISEVRVIRRNIARLVKSTNAFPWVIPVNLRIHPSSASWNLAPSLGSGIPLAR